MRRRLYQGQGQLVRRRVYVKGRGFREVVSNIYNRVKNVLKNPYVRGPLAMAGERLIIKGRDRLNDKLMERSLTDPIAKITNTIADKVLMKVQPSAEEFRMNNPNAAEFITRGMQQVGLGAGQRPTRVRRKRAIESGNLVGNLPTVINQYTAHPPPMPPMSHLSTHDIQAVINEATGGKPRRGRKKQTGAGFAFVR